VKLWWAKQAVRINALSMRERVFLFLSIIACLMALADVLYLSPAQVAHKQLTVRFEKQSAELQRARDELKSIGVPVDTAKAARDEVAAVKIRVGEVNQTIQEQLAATPESSPLAQVLVHLLRRHEGLTLVRTSAVAPDATPVDTKATGAGTGAASVGLTRQGVELTVAGAYPELTRYVHSLEKALPHVRWGVMTLKSDKQPTELTLQLFLIGLQP
jgi:MSHA biogenesis protein MshJ